VGGWERAWGATGGRMLGCWERRWWCGGNLKQEEGSISKGKSPVAHKGSHHLLPEPRILLLHGFCRPFPDSSTRSRPPALSRPPTLPGPAPLTRNARGMSVDDGSSTGAEQQRQPTQALLLALLHRLRTKHTKTLGVGGQG